MSVPHWLEGQHNRIGSITVSGQVARKADAFYLMEVETHRRRLKDPLQQLLARDLNSILAMTVW